ncbi:hypothetical protein KQX54_017117 [Cotesia glomerata]|uniref:Uncharacterized protein n=1 Tax=Cotesia glomerata TaxID=32391 RepID=A0AAV7IBA6_COTGL|nr:hypothetical protein KQX54_017117 [Cotesia glomerata]
MPRKCSRSRRSTENVQISRRKKRTQTFNPKTTETDESSFSASAKKFKMQKEILVSRDPSIEYRILNFITVFAAISEYVQSRLSLHFVWYKRMRVDSGAGAACKPLKARELFNVFTGLLDNDNNDNE